MPPPLEHVFNACVHAEKIDDTQLAVADIQTIISKGLLYIKVYGSPERGETGATGKFLIFRFESETPLDIPGIETALDPLTPTFCFVDICPRVGDIQCPAGAR